MSLPAQKKRIKSAQQRKFAVEQVLKHKKSVSGVARELGVARKTLYSWIKRYESASSRSKSKAFENQYPVGKNHPLAISNKDLPLLKRLVVLHPDWGCRKYSEELKRKGIDLGYFGVHKLLKSLGASTPDLRKNFKRSWSGPGRLDAGIKLEAVKKILDREMSISQASKEYGMARKTIYQWIEKYQRGIEKNIGGAAALKEAYARGETHPRAIYPQLQDKLLDMVAKQPELSVRRLANRLPASSWTVWSMLDRNNLNRYEQRLAYSKTQEVAPKPVFARFLDRARYVLEQFVPSLAPAPPPERRQRFFSVLKIFGVSVLASFLFGFGILFWIRIISQAATTSSAIGLVFASIAFLMGSLFFLYSLKYYLTLALVLSFSQIESANNIEQRMKGRGRGFLSWILGLNGRSPTSPEDVRGKAVGLSPNLEHVRLKRKPYVSIHIPFYNEKEVVQRSIAAAASFDYPEYEVILCDDSTDETTTIIREYQKEHLAKGERLRTIENKKEGWTLTSVEVRPGVTLKHIHRTSRSGFKGGALKLALTLVNPRTEFVSVFDADFIPYPDTLELFLKYFQATAGTLDFRKVTKKKDSATSNIAAVQGYQ